MLVLDEAVWRSSAAWLELVLVGPLSKDAVGKLPALWSCSPLFFQTFGSNLILYSGEVLVGGWASGTCGFLTLARLGLPNVVDMDHRHWFFARPLTWSLLHTASASSVDYLEALAAVIDGTM